MSLRGYKRKTRPANWTLAFPNEKTIGGLIRKTAAKVRQRIRRTSTRQRQRLKDYRIARSRFMREHPRCEACAKIAALGHDLDEKPHAASEPHHVRGRAGKLLTDTRYFLAVCRKAHEWIHAHPALARSLGLLAPPGQWNRT